VEITTEVHGDGAVLSPAGRIDTASAPVLEQAITSAIEGGTRKILLDLSAVSYISSGGLRVLLSAAKRLREPGDRFGLCCLTPEVLKIIKLTGFTSIFNIYPSEGEARAGW
jgi:anti-anti-sigma factor